MSGIRSLLTFVPLALAWASQDAVASPSFPFSHSTHDTRSIGRRGLEIETYNPPSTFEVRTQLLYHLILDSFHPNCAHPLCLQTFGSGLLQSRTVGRRETLSIEEETCEFVANKLNKCWVSFWLPVK